MIIIAAAFIWGYWVFGGHFFDPIDVNDANEMITQVDIETIRTRYHIHVMRENVKTIVDLKIQNLELIKECKVNEILQEEFSRTIDLTTKNLIDSNIKYNTLLDKARIQKYQINKLLEHNNYLMKSLARLTNEITFLKQEIINLKKD